MYRDDMSSLKCRNEFFAFTFPNSSKTDMSGNFIAKTGYYKEKHPLSKFQAHR